ncbi:MAG: hypothetical protein AAF602_04705 [Myxococcota bacterium]
MGLGTVLACVTIGLVLGLGARIVIPGPDPFGVGITTVLSVIAAVLGGLGGAWNAAQPWIFEQPVGPIGFALLASSLVVVTLRVFGRGQDVTLE